MEDRITEIEYAGLKIVYTNLSELSANEAIAVLQQTLIEIPKYGEKSVYSLLNVKHLEFNSELMKVFNKVGSENLQYVVGTAVCGLSSMTRLLAKGVVAATGRKADFFKDIEEGKDWLLEVSRGNK